MSGRLFSLACQQCWAIQPEALQQILEIVSRENIPDFEAVAAKRAARMDGTESSRIRNGVSIIPVLGPIVRRADFFSDISGATSVEALARDFNAALNDPIVSSILFEFDSPGGEATGINEFAQMIADARGRKPIVAYVDGMAASAAYWLASATDEIVANDTALLGSIGVVAKIGNPDAKKASDVKFISSQSPNKQANPNTEKGAAQYQALVDHMAEVFISTVAINRGVTEERVLTDFGAGGVIVGRRAVDAGLADRLGSFESTLNELAAGKWMPKRKHKAATAQAEEQTMAEEKGLKERILAALGMSDEEKPAASIDTKAKEQEVRIAAAEKLAAEREVEAATARKQYAEEYAARVKAEASSFASSALLSGKITAAEKAGVVESYLQAAADDLSMPKAEGVSRVDMLKTGIEGRKAHAMFEEKIPDKGARALETERANDASATLTAEREKELLGMTGLGQAALKAVK